MNEISIEFQNMEVEERMQDQVLSVHISRMDLWLPIY